MGQRDHRARASEPTSCTGTAEFGLDQLDHAGDAASALPTSPSSRPSGRAPGRRQTGIHDGAGGQGPQSGWLSLRQNRSPSSRCAIASAAASSSRRTLVDCPRRPPRGRRRRRAAHRPDARRATRPGHAFPRSPAGVRDRGSPRVAAPESGQVLPAFGQRQVASKQVPAEASEQVRRPVVVLLVQRPAHQVAATRPITLHGCGDRLEDRQTTTNGRAEVDRLSRPPARPVDRLEKDRPTHQKV